MTPQDQHIALMKSLGWTDICEEDVSWSMSRIMRYCGVPPNGLRMEFPDLTLDLMHEAESTLQHYGAFCDELAKVMGVKRGSISLVCATKEQRLEAYLRVKGLWNGS